MVSETRTLGFKENPKRFWSFYRAKTNSKSLPNIIKNKLDNGASNPQDMAQLFSNYFYSAFNGSPPNLLPKIHESKDPRLKDVLFKECDVYEILTS